MRCSDCLMPSRVWCCCWQAARWAGVRAGVLFHCCDSRCSRCWLYSVPQRWSVAGQQQQQSAAVVAGQSTKPGIGPVRCARKPGSPPEGASVLGSAGAGAGAGGRRDSSSSSSVGQRCAVCVARAVRASVPRCWSLAPGSPFETFLLSSSCSVCRCLAYRSCWLAGTARHCMHGCSAGACALQRPRTSLVALYMLHVAKPCVLQVVCCSCEGVAYSGGTMDGVPLFTWCGLGPLRASL